MSTTEVTCLCGEVRLRLAGAPIVRFYCHCDDCRVVHGGAHVARAIYPADAVAAFLLPELSADFHIHCRLALAPVRDELPHYRGLPAQLGGTDDRVDW